MSLPIIVKDIEDRLKVSGGNVDGNLFLNGSVSKYSSGDQNYIHFLKGSVSQGYLGVNGENNPVFISADATTIYDLYGEHNKPTAGDIGAVPTSRTINGKALSSNITLSASDVGAAATSHGNHVPATETANNAKFLRNDNTWQTVTPANIGAAASSHGTHVSYGTSASALGTSSAGSATTVSRSDHVHALPALTSCTGTLTVAKGGTGATTFTSGAALIGAGTGAVTTRAITNNTALTSAISRNTNLVTMNTLSYALARTTNPTQADTNYTTYMVRAIAANTSALTANSSTLASGTIYLQYES